MFQALNKKEHKGCESPDPAEPPDPYTPGLRDDKYDRLPNDDYQRAMQQNAAMRQVRTLSIDTRMKMTDLETKLPLLTKLKSFGYKFETMSSLHGIVANS